MSELEHYGFKRLLDTWLLIMGDSVSWETPFCGGFLEL